MRGRRRDSGVSDRAVWQAVSLLLTYPDDGRCARLATVAELLDHVTGPPRAPLLRALAALRDRDGAAEEYVETFDLGRRTTMYLTYWTAGDTRNRGAAMHEFVAVYRRAGVFPPKSEAPDYLPVLLEFAATVDPEAGRRLLCEHRIPIAVLADALAARRSPYAPAVEALCATLPAGTDEERQRARRLAEAGPPTEAVGLQPFTLTVPPRRTEGVG